ncbi:MAG: hypothetical protein AB7S38_01150 [Vulcanimicrobiota bacterium]
MNTLYQNISQRMHRPRPEPRTIDMQTMVETMAHPQGESSLVVQDGLISLQQEPGAPSPIVPWSAPTPAQVWSAFHAEARPGVTTPSDERLISSLTFGGPQATDQAVPVAQAQFRSGLTLTAEEAGLRVAGASSTFLAGVAMELTRSGLRLHGNGVSQTITPRGEHLIEATDPSASDGRTAKFGVESNGTVSGSLADGSRVGRTRRQLDASTTLTTTSQVDGDGSIEVGPHRIKPHLNFHQTYHIRREDAADLLSDARLGSRDADSRARHADNFGRWEGVSNHVGLREAQAADHDYRFAEGAYHDGNYRATEDLALESLDHSRESSFHSGRVEREAVDIRRHRDERERRTRGYGGSGSFYQTAW